MSPSSQRGHVLLEQGRYSAAEKYFREALAADPEDAEAHYFLAVCLSHQDREKEALASVDRAVARDPEFSPFHAYRAMLLADLGRREDALRAGEEAVRLDPESDYAHSALAAVFLAQREWGRAEEAARKALELNPDSAAASNQLAHALRLQNRLAESAEQTAYMLSENPEDPHTRVTAGWTALQSGDHRGAEQHFLEALRMDASDPAAREGLKESFRARSPLYRGYLAYSFALQRFTERKQWLIILGLLFAVRFARAVLPGPLATLVVVLYFLFVLWAHVARAVGNFGLLFDRSARHSLDRAERTEAVIAGGGVVLGLPLFLAGMAGGWDVAGLAGLTLVAAAFPFAYTFTNKAVAGRIAFGMAGGFVWAAGLAKIFVAWGILAPSSQIDAAAGLAGIAVVAVTWLANVPALHKRA